VSVPKPKRRLEGPGSEARLQSLHARFRAANPQNHPFQVIRRNAGRVLIAAAAVAVAYWYFAR